jgi:mannitol/fructose-specific phosphotransferase system IIA component (Ntr-type)
LTPELVRLQAKVNDWQEAVILAGELLEKNGYVEERYIKATLEAVRKLGPYIVIAPGIAIPHARPEDGALRTGISLVTLAMPVCFGSEDNDPVDLIIGLSSSDGRSHIELFKRMCNFLSNDENVARLRQMKDPDAVATFINDGKPR